MAQSNLRIVIDAINQATGDLNALKGQLAGLEDAGKKGGAGIGEATGAVEALTGISLTGMGAITAVGGALAFSVGEAMSAERQMAATAAVIKSTGGAAGLTTQQVMAMTSSEQALTGIQDDVVGSGINMLLTFKNIGGDTMPRATRAMEDMAAAMSGGDIAALDLRGTAIQLGKALNDPVQGLSALSRVGVTFTADQERLIKGFVETGDVAKAQSVILQELESEFGGMAEAMGETNVGKIQKAKNALADLGEAIGNQLLPVLGDAAESATILMTSSQMIGDALEQQEAKVTKTAKSYEEYVRQMLESKAAVTGVSVTDQSITEVIGRLNDANDQSIKLTGMLTREQWENQRATNAQIDSVKGYANAGASMLEITAGMSAATVKLTDDQKAMIDAQRAHASMMAGVTSDAIRLGDAEKRRSEIETELAAIDRQIAANGPVRSVSIRNEKMSTDEMAVAQAKLAKATADLDGIQRGAKESETDYALRVAQARAAVADLSTALGEHTAVVGGATEAQIKQKEALQATLDEMQRTAEIDAAKSAFAALGDALKAGTLSESDYRTAMMTLNDATGLFSEKALATATNSALMVDGIRKAKVPDDVLASVVAYGGALGDAASQALKFSDLEAKVAEGKNVTGTYAGGHAERIAATAANKPAEIPAQPSLDAYYEKLVSADALQANVGTFPDTAAAPVPALIPVGDYIGQLDLAKAGQDDIGAFPAAGAIPAAGPLSGYTAQLQVALDLQKQIGDFTMPATPTLAEVEREQRAGITSPPAAPGYQAGADFIVPPGYPNDSFPIRVSSGERVMVTPADLVTQSVLINEMIRMAKVPADVVREILQYGAAPEAQAQAQIMAAQMPAISVAPVMPPAPVGPGFQTGADFVVPAGYPNDSFGMRVSSGERVTVAPASAGNSNYQNSTFHTTINDPRTGAAFMAWLREQQRPSFERG